MADRDFAVWVMGLFTAYSTGSSLGHGMGFIFGERDLSSLRRFEPCRTEDFMSDWIRHNSTDPPALAPAALVEVIARNGYESFKGYQTTKDRVYKVSWGYVHEYRQLTDPQGIPYCSAEGLEPWAEYVFTDQIGKTWQANRNPYHLDPWRVDTNHTVYSAPNTHRHPGDWNDSLMRVWRA